MNISGYPVEVLEVRGRSSSVRIRAGKVVLKVSRYARGSKRDEIIEKFLKWAQRKLEKVDLDDFVLPDYRDGGQVVTHNKVYDLKMIVESSRKRKKVVLQDGLITVFLPRADEATFRYLVEKEIMKDQKDYLEEVLDDLNQRFFQEDYNQVRFKRVSSRFGSCSAKRNINIAYRLLFAPREVFRYVCVHELAHLKEMNHSKRFWALVLEAMPEYMFSERWLEQKGFLLG